MTSSAPTTDVATPSSAIPHSSAYDAAVKWCGLAATHRLVLGHVPPGSRTRRARA